MCTHCVLREVTFSHVVGLSLLRPRQEGGTSNRGMAGTGLQVPART